VARLEQLLGDVADAKLRRDLEAEVAALKERTKFGLVYERHLPETALVSDVNVIQPGDLVRPKQDVDKDVSYRVAALEGDEAVIIKDGNGTQLRVSIADLFVVLPFGEPIYPTLESVGSVHRSDSQPYHAVINGENFHALQLLTYMYAGKVDCLYLDPPYNSGATDWRYNNSYVDVNDSYRHSKWLSFMEKRLRLAKRLLKADGVLIITIDENEVHHLGVLLEEIFPEYLRYMITLVINPKGTAKVNFSRVEEYAFFVVPNTGEDVIAQLPAPGDEPETVWEDEAGDEDDDELEDELEAVPDGEQNGDVEVEEEGGVAFSKLYLRRRGAHSSYRPQRPNQFYGIKVDEKTLTVKGIGPEIDEDDHPRNSRKGKILTVYPVDAENNERVWRYGRETMARLIKAGQIRVGKFNPELDTYTLNHWKPIAKEKAGLRRVRTVWWRSRHDAGTHGTTLIANLLGRRGAFPYPKSLYAVRDTLEAVVKDRPDALIVDFFAGSGTTLHATALLNAEDGGRRRCVLVTNNEVDPKTTRQLNKAGFYRGDPEFEAEGIFQAATMPRVQAALSGERPDGTPIPRGKKYRYLDGRAFADGFDENVEFFRLDYLNPDSVELGQSFQQIHPALWLAAGGHGKREAANDKKPYFVGSTFAILFDVASLGEFEDALQDRDEISHVFVKTDSADAFAEVRERLGRDRETSMLYRDFLRHFRVNAPRNV
jgi:adenine-specific DNA-methyltransferase